MKKAKQVLSILLAVLLIVLAVPAVFASEPTVITSGNCGADGDNAIWALTNDQTLTIKGRGVMEDDVQFHALIQDDVELYIIQSYLRENGYHFSTSEEAINLFYSLDNVESIQMDYMPAMRIQIAPRQLIIEEGLNEIGSLGFCQFGSSLSSVKLPESLTRIGRGAFSNCFKIRNIKIPNNVRLIDDYAFANVPIEELSIPASCDRIGENSFYLTQSTRDLYFYNDNLTCEGAFKIPTWSNLISDSLLKNYTQLYVSRTILKSYFEILTDEFGKEYYTHFGVPVFYFISDSLQEMFSSIGMDTLWLSATNDEEIITTLIGIINQLLGTSFSDLNDLFCAKEVENSYGGIETHYDESETFQCALNTWNEALINNGINLENYPKVIALGESSKGNRPYPWLTIHANPGSVAHQMALASGVKFECLNHAYSSEITKPATCQEEGIRTYTCPDCGKTYTEAIEKTAHTPGAAVKENETAATTEHGGSYDEVVRCTVCNTELSRTQKTTDPLPKPSEPGDSNQGNNDQNQDSGKKLNFFQRIIEWFRNLFQRLTSIFRR